jgi:hypothetical protein
MTVYEAKKRSTVIVLNRNFRIRAGAEWFGLAALGQAVARLSSGILPSSSTAGPTERPTGATPKVVLAICERVAEVQALRKALSR